MITLTPQAPEPESKFSSPETARPGVVDQAAITDRANKAEYGLENLPGTSTANLTESFALGFEDLIRDQATVAADIRERKKRLGMVEEIARAAAAEGREISSIERDFIMGLSATELQNNPATILEQLYAQRYIDEAIEAGPVNTESAYGEAVSEDPEQAIEIGRAHV